MIANAPTVCGRVYGRVMSLCALAGLWFVTAACGPSAPPPPSPGKLVGESCAQTKDCQDGLLCEEGSCAYARCTTALNPEAYCAQRLNLAINRIICDPQGQCRERMGSLDDPCEQDSGCDFGLICESQRCVEVCLSNASCFEEMTACLARDSDPEVRFCRAADLSCAPGTDYASRCAQTLGVKPQAITCEQGQCVVAGLARDQACDQDGECARSLICEGGRCTPSCEPEGPEPCPEPQRCLARQEQDGWYCQ